MHTSNWRQEKRHDRQKNQWSTDEKVRIVLQTFDPQASMAEYADSTTWLPEPHTTGRKGLSLQDATLLMGPMAQSRPEITKKRYLNSRG